jgi:hypothetical protein
MSAPATTTATLATEAKVDASAATAAAPPATFLYFAIGSMINPTSLALRNLKPTNSVPAIVHDWELKFAGEGNVNPIHDSGIAKTADALHEIIIGGMGTVEEKKGAHLHGVLHTMSKQDMDALDKMEGTPLSCSYVPFDGALID